MTRRYLRRFLPVLLVLCACSSEDDKAEKEKECESIAADIRSAAMARGIPIRGACNDPSAPELVSPCAKLRECNAEVDRL